MDCVFHVTQACGANSMQRWSAKPSVASRMCSVSATAALVSQGALGYNAKIPVDHLLTHVHHTKGSYGARTVNTIVNQTYVISGLFYVPDDWVEFPMCDDENQWMEHDTMKWCSPGILICPGKETNLFSPTTATNTTCSNVLRCRGHWLRWRYISLS